MVSFTVVMIQSVKFYSNVCGWRYSELKCKDCKYFNTTYAGGGCWLTPDTMFVNHKEPKEASDECSHKEMYLYYEAFGIDPHPALSAAAKVITELINGLRAGGFISKD